MANHFIVYCIHKCTWMMAISVGAHSRPSFQNEWRKQAKNAADTMRALKVIYRFLSLFFGTFLQRKLSHLFHFFAPCKLDFVFLVKLDGKYTTLQSIYVPIQMVSHFFCLPCNEWNSYCTHNSTLCQLLPRLSCSLFILMFFFCIVFHTLTSWCELHMIRKCVFLFTMWLTPFSIYVA